MFGGGGGALQHRLLSYCFSLLLLDRVNLAPHWFCYQHSEKVGHQPVSSPTYLPPCGCVRVESLLPAPLLWTVPQHGEQRTDLLSCSVCGVRVLPTQPSLTGDVRRTGSFSFSVWLRYGSVRLFFPLGVVPAGGMGFSSIPRMM